ncbi:hypothetical protein LCGC14_2170980, partial [marine sediment metagenome]
MLPGERSTNEQEDAMSRAQTPTKLPLATWAKILQMNPLHFEGVNIPEQTVVYCNTAMMQHNWQASDAVSREEIADALECARRIRPALTMGEEPHAAWSILMRTLN